MHFLIHNDIRQNQTVRWLLVTYLISILAFLILHPFYESANLGLFPKDIDSHVRGSQDLFLEARSLTDLVTDVHVKLFLHIFIGLILSSLVTRTKLRRGVLNALIAALFVIPLLESASLFAVSILGGAWAHAKAAFFLALWFVQFGLSSYLLVFLFQKRRR